MCVSNKIDSSLLVTVVIFIAGLWISARSQRSSDKKSKIKAEETEKLIRRQYLLALREEIGLNIEALKKSISKFPTRAELSIFLAACRKNRPFVTFSYHTLILRNRTEVLQDLPDTLIKNIVDFYGKLDELALDVAGINSPAFVTISDDGRLDTFMDIKEQLHVALQQGETMRDAITQHLTDKFGAPGI